MNVEQFFDLLLKELEVNPKLRGYYRFLDDPKLFAFRKAYYCQRLQYVKDNIQKGEKVWDIGCGYGTTAIFLALNGVDCIGSTLEYYYDEIPNHLEYWSQFGDVSSVKVQYELLEDAQYEDHSFDVILAQDTLHHLEPLQKNLDIIHQKLKPAGRLVSIEENGCNIINKVKLYLKRGNKKVVEIYDEKLGKSFLMGDENVRHVDSWDDYLKKSNLVIDKSSIEYVRFYLPYKYKGNNIEQVLAKEKQITSSFLIKYFFFGVNFVAHVK